MNRKEATFVIAAMPVVAAVILVLLIDYSVDFYLSQFPGNKHMCNCWHYI